MDSITIPAPVEIELNGVPCFVDLKGHVWAISIDDNHQHAIQLIQDERGLWHYRNCVLARQDGMFTYVAYYRPFYGSGYYERVDAFQAARSEFSGRDIRF
jgi:hypothetical protein